MIITTDYRPARESLCISTLLFLCARVSVHGQGDPGEHPALPQLTELFWALFLLMASVLSSIVWVAMIRRNVRRQSETVRHRETALAEHYRELFENAHDIIFTHDLKGNLTSLNRAGEEILGFTRHEAMHLNFGQIVAPDWQKTYHEALEHLKGGQGDTFRELEVRAKDGRRVVLRIDLRLQHLAGKPNRIQGIAWDITEQKKAEEALRESELRLRRSLEERVRIGRDLHDGIIQSIYAIGLGLGECRRLIKEIPEQAEARLAKSIADLNSVIRDVRDFIVGLEPDAVKGGEFKTTLQSLVVTMSEAHAARFLFEIDPGAADQLSTHQATQLLQIAREAMSNSVRHARASQTIVSLQTLNGHVQLEVRDDGIGFEQGNVTTTGFGLRNIEARARDLGARSDITSTRGKGTRVAIQVPSFRVL